MLKIQIMDMLLPWLLKTGGKLLITVLIAVIGYKVIRAIRKGVGRSMEKAGLEVTLRKFLDALLSVSYTHLQRRYCFFPAPPGPFFQIRSLSSSWPYQ